MGGMGKAMDATKTRSATARGVIKTVAAFMVWQLAGSLCLAADYYGAIGYSPSTTKTSTSVNATDVDDSVAALKRLCGRDARVVWARNSWSALAVGNDRSWGTGTGETEDDAAAAAIENCPNGKVRVTVFSGKDFYKLDGTDWVYWYTDRGIVRQH